MNFLISSFLFSKNYTKNVCCRCGAGAQRAEDAERADEEHPNAQCGAVEIAFLIKNLANYLDFKEKSDSK